MTKLKARTVLGFVSIIGYILITGGFFIILFFGEQVKMPSGDLGKQIIGMLGLVVGTWNAALLMVFTFHFGSSEGSKAKDDLMNKLKPN